MNELLKKIIEKRRLKKDPYSFITESIKNAKEDNEKDNVEQLKELRTFLLESVGTIIQDLEDSKNKIYEELQKSINAIELQQGIAGINGKDGLDGKNGINGKNGKDGKDGKDGKNGLDGLDGQIGKDGKDGKDGKSGKDGAPDTPDQVIDKIHKSEKLIAYTKIEGLVQMIKNLKKTPKEKGGGGGMGNLQHETKSVNSGTTTITTNYKIAMNGYGIVSSIYNGGGITRGTHYTVGADRKTLTLLFMPDDAPVSYIDLIYIRG